MNVVKVYDFSVKKTNKKQSYLEYCVTLDQLYQRFQTFYFINLALSKKFSKPLNRKRRFHSRSIPLSDKYFVHKKISPWS